MPFGPAAFPPTPQVEIPTENATAIDPTPANLKIPARLSEPVAAPERPRNPLLIPFIVTATVAVLAIVSLIVWILRNPR
jgi:hypothetical protein